jgi:hypothetical protein
MAEPEVAYTYWVLRYVPVPVRGEFINIGVVVGGHGSEWAIRRIHDLGRANRLGGSPPEAANWLLRLENLISPIPTYFDNSLDLRLRKRDIAPDESWMERLRRQQENNFQISEARPVVASSADEAADRLFDLLVVSPTERAMPRGRTRAVRALKEEVYLRLPGRSYQSDVRLVAGAQRTRLEFAFGRSKITQLTQVVAFDVRAVDHLATTIQSSSYTFSRLRRQGAVLLNPRRKNQGEQAIERDVALRVLYVPPETPEQIDVYKMATDAWQDLGMHAYSFGEEPDLVKEAAFLVETA